MHNTLKKYSFFAILLIIILFLIICYFLIDKNNNYTSINKEDIVFKIKDSNIISIYDDFPMSDDLGKKIKYDRDNLDVQSYLEFEIKSKAKVGTNYEIYARELGNNSIHSNYIKIYLTDENNNSVNEYKNNYVSTFYDLNKSSINSLSKKVYYGYIEPGETKKFILRVWISDSYVIGNVRNNFKMKLYAEAE